MKKNNDSQKRKIEISMSTDEEGNLISSFYGMSYEKFDALDELGKLRLLLIKWYESQSAQIVELEEISVLNMLFEQATQAEATVNLDKYSEEIDKKFSELEEIESSLTEKQMRIKLIEIYKWIIQMSNQDNNNYDTSNNVVILEEEPKHEIISIEEFDLFHSKELDFKSGTIDRYKWITHLIEPDNLRDTFDKIAAISRIAKSSHATTGRFIKDDILHSALMGLQSTKTSLDMWNGLNAKNISFENAKSEMSRINAAKGLKKDPKQRAKNYIKDCWTSGRADGSLIGSYKAAFARKMLADPRCATLVSSKKIEDWCRDWEKSHPTS